MRHINSFRLKLRLNPILAAAIAVLIAGSVLTAASQWERGYDDAYISYRYARNLADGNGLVFNPGERVEGYSNFLYVVLVSAGLLAVPGEYVYFISLCLNLIFILAACVVFYMFVRDELDEPSANAAVALFALCTVFWRYVASGLETPLIVLVQLGLWIGIRRYERCESTGPLRAMCVLVVLSVLSRADGFVMPCMALGYLLIKGHRRAAVHVGITLATTVTVYFGWRYFYYGYPLPNTYYVKVAGTLAERVRYAAGQLGYVVLADGIVPYSTAIVIASFLAVRDGRANAARLRDAVSPELFFAAGWLAYWFYVGGDVMGDRFLIMLFPLGTYSVLSTFREKRHFKPAAVLTCLILLNLVWQFSADLGRQMLGFVTMPHFHHLIVASLVANIVLIISIATERLPKRASLLTVLILLLFAGFHPSSSGNLYGLSDARDIWIVLGRFLGERHPGQTIAVDAAGKIPYFSNLYTIDMLGLNNEHIAHLDKTGDYFPGHSKYDPAYVLSREPDLIAAWLRTDLGLQYGLDSETYDTAGYELAYLTGYLGKDGSLLPVAVINVLGESEETVRQRMTRGYNYAVLLRTRPDAPG